MIVARNKSEEYIVDSALLGNWSVPAELQEDAHTLCGGVSRRDVQQIYCSFQLQNACN